MKNPKIKVYENEAYEILDEKTDYLNYVTRSSTKAQREKFMIGDILINGAVCLKCGEFIRSINLYDYKSCKCGAVKVDGGSHYAKRCGKQEDYINVVEPFYDANKETI